MKRTVLGMAIASALVLLSAPAFAQRGGGGNGGGGAGGGAGGPGADGRGNDAEAWTGAFFALTAPRGTAPEAPKVKARSKSNGKTDGTQSCATGTERFRSRIGNTRENLCRDN